MDLTAEFREKLSNLKQESIKSRKRTVFIDSVLAPGETLEFPVWKSLTKLQKMKKLNEYCKIHSINTVLTLNCVSNYSISNIVFCKFSQQVKSVELSKKK